MDKGKVIQLMYKYYIEYGTLKPRNAKPSNIDYRLHIQEKVLVEYLAERVDASTRDPLDELEYWEEMLNRILGEIEYRDGMPIRKTLQIVNWTAHNEHFLYEMIKYIRTEYKKR